MHWFTTRSATKRLRAAGFSGIRDRWQLRMPNEHRGIAALVVRLARRFAAVRFIGNRIVPGCSFLARKP